MKLSYLVFILFFLMALAIIVSSHYFFYRTAARHLLADSVLAKKILAYSLTVLGSSFLLTNILLRVFENGVTKYFYFLASLWLGIFLYLFFGSLLIKLIETGMIMAKVSLPLKTVSFVVYGVALLLSAYGYYNALHPVIKNISVPIAGLPPSWQGKTIVQISDVHLGAINRADFINRVVEQINSLKPAAVVITGDYFDGTCSQYGFLSAPLKNIEAPAGIYFSIGNHETYINETAALTAAREAGAKILDNDAVKVDGLTIAGLSWPQMGVKDAHLELFQRLNPAEPTILLYHDPRLTKEARAAGIDLQLAGHIHRGQLWPVNLISRLIYGPYYYGLHREGDYTIYTTAGTGTWGPPLRIGNRPEITAITLTAK
jgi:uncharacterized protein